MKICIDPGHGGKDSGALGKRGGREKDIVLDISLRLGKYLSKLGHEIIYTRTKDVFIYLSERSSVSDANNCDLFVSIHCNACAGGHGTETYYYPTSKEGKILATNIQNSLIKVNGLTNRGIKTAGFSVLRHTKCTAVLVETAFIDDEKEEVLLMTEEFRDLIAKAIAEGISGQAIEKKNNTRKDYVSHYVYGFQKFYNQETKTRNPIKIDGIYGEKTKKAYKTLGQLMEGEY